MFVCNLKKVEKRSMGSKEAERNFEKPSSTKEILWVFFFIGYNTFTLAFYLKKDNKYFYTENK